MQENKKRGSASFFSSSQRLQHIDDLELAVGEGVELGKKRSTYPLKCLIISKYIPTSFLHSLIDTNSFRLCASLILPAPKIITGPFFLRIEASVKYLTVLIFVLTTFARFSAELLNTGSKLNLTLIFDLTNGFTFLRKTDESTTVLYATVALARSGTILSAIPPAIFPMFKIFLPKTPSAPKSAFLNAAKSSISTSIAFRPFSGIDP